jgi:osmotically-inducible protein OsmY
MFDRTVKALAGFVLALTLTVAPACSNNQKAASQTKDNVEKSLQQAGFKDLKVDMDADKRVVTLNGKVPSQELKDRAESAAKSAANGFIVANQISIEPVGQEAAARKIEENIDDSIEKTYKALLIANHMDEDGIHFKSKNGLLTLDGKVKTADIRTSAEKLGATVPHVTQVVNKIEVKK